MNRFLFRNQHTIVTLLPGVRLRFPSVEHQFCKHQGPSHLDDYYSREILDCNGRLKVFVFYFHFNEGNGYFVED